MEVLKTIFFSFVTKNWNTSATDKKKLKERKKKKNSFKKTKNEKATVGGRVLNAYLGNWAGIEFANYIQVRSTLFCHALFTNKVLAR